MADLLSFLDDKIRNRVVRGAGHFRSGDLFGIELECEGSKVDVGGSEAVKLLNGGWSPHNDGSLRANHGSSCEWVFNGPVDYEASLERISDLFKYFEARKARLVTSNRTSTHIHFNMGDKKVYQLINLFVLFTIFEDILDRYCGEDRRGNLFCLSSRMAGEQIAWVESMCFETNDIDIRENNRYCSLNLAALTKFGTVEFRGMRGLDNVRDMSLWLKIINYLCDYACWKMRSPSKLIEDISLKSPVGVFREVFVDTSEELLSGLTEEELVASVYEGIRLIQVLAYRVNEVFDKVKPNTRDFWAEIGKKTKSKPKKLDDDLLDGFLREFHPVEVPDVEIVEPAPEGIRNPWFVDPVPFFGRQMPEPLPMNRLRNIPIGARAVNNPFVENPDEF